MQPLDEGFLTVCKAGRAAGPRCRYNRYVTFRLIPLCFAGLLAIGCTRTNVQSEAAVRQGVINYLNTKYLSLSAMQVDVSSVTFRQNEADALVSFRPKGADAAAGAMQIRYTLERKGNAWVVKGRGAGADAHGTMPPTGMGQMPPAGMQMPPAAGASKLPEGHPPMGAMAPAEAKPKK